MSVLRSQRNKMPRTTSYRKEKLPEILTHMAAEFLAHESNRTSLITVTGCRLSPDSKRAQILYTVLPESQENAAKDFLSRKTLAFKAFVQEKSRIGRIPHLFFVFDAGEKNRQKIDFLLKNSL